tara:strand:+ start:64 stop:981 length:918 start_codon:yes stop_codon:yes gene_type:complete
MPTNVYFNHAVQSEQDLHEDLVVESLRFYGHEVFYLPRTIVDEDELFGEDTSSKFGDAYAVEMYIENTEGFEGEGDLLSKFGVEVRDQATFVLSKRTWQRFISLDQNLATSTRPQEGDLIYFPLGNQVFEIRFVEHENPFYQLGKLNVFKLQCETFEYSHEEIDVGIAELDNIEDQFSYQVTMTLGAGSGDFVVGETVTQTVSSGKTVSGNVVSYSSVGESTKTLNVNNITFSDTDVPATNTMFVLSSNAGAGNIVGATSGASRVVSVAPDQYVTPNDPLADNKDFETAGANIVDFSETNPFGSL